MSWALSLLRMSHRKCFFWNIEIMLVSWSKFCSSFLSSLPVLSHVCWFLSSVHGESAKCCLEHWQLKISRWKNMFSVVYWIYVDTSLTVDGSEDVCLMLFDIIISCLMSGWVFSLLFWVDEWLRFYWLLLSAIAGVVRGSRTSQVLLLSLTTQMLRKSEQMWWQETTGVLTFMNALHWFRC